MNLCSIGCITKLILHICRCSDVTILHILQVNTLSVNLHEKSAYSHLKEVPSYGGSSNRELLIRIYEETFTVPEESFELRRGTSNRKSSYRESTV